MEKPTPKLLKNYAEARLLLQAKGWPIEKAAEHLSEQPGLEGIHLSHPVLSRKSAKGGDVPLEPALAVAIEGMPAQKWHEARAAVVEAGLRAVHGEPPTVTVDVHKLANDLRGHMPASDLAQDLADSLAEKTEPGSFIDNVACGIADRLKASRLVQELGERVDRLSLKRIAITAAVAALVACVALVVAPAFAARPASSLVVVIPGAALDGSAVRLEPAIFLGATQMGEKAPAEQRVPAKTLPGQKVEPCDREVGEVSLYGNCWLRVADVTPPCPRLFRHGDSCYRPIAADPSKPVEPAPNRPPSP